MSKYNSLCLSAIKKIYTAANIMQNKDFKRFNLTSSQGEVLFSLFRSDEQEINQRNIESRLQLSNPTVTGILNRLEEKGFIKRVSSANDRRYKHVGLTEESTAIKEEIYSDIYAHETKLLGGFTDAEKEQLKIYLQRILKNIAED